MEYELWIRVSEMAMELSELLGQTRLLTNQDLQETRDFVAEVGSVIVEGLSEEEAGSEVGRRFRRMVEACSS